MKRGGGDVGEGNQNGRKEGEEMVESEWVGEGLV